MVRVVLPVNFSSEVRISLIAFIKQMLERNEQVHFCLLHAYDTMSYGSAMLRNLSERLGKNADKDLQYEKNKILEQVPEANITTYVGKGSLAQVVNDYERQVPVDFMVVALKGSNMIQSILASSKPSQLAGQSNIPMLFLPDADHVNLPTEVAFGTDVKPFENTEDFDHLLNMCRYLGAKLHFVYVNEEGESKEKEFKENYVEHLYDAEYDYTEIEGTDAAKEILEFIKKRNLNGIALIERKGNFLKRLFSVSLLDEMLYLAKLPIMVINELRDVN